MRCHGGYIRGPSWCFALVSLGSKSLHSSGFCFKHFTKSHNCMQLKLPLRFIESTRGDDSSGRKIRFLEEIFVIRDGSDNMILFVSLTGYVSLYAPSQTWLVYFCSAKYENISCKKYFVFERIAINSN